MQKQKPAFLATLGAFVATAAFAQAVPPRFEVASIKPPAVRGPAMIRQLPGRLTADAPLRALLQTAYDLPPFQIAGGPEWVDSEPYEIDAKSAGNPGRGQMLVMLQLLLLDRFQLRFHRESRDVPVYVLGAARGGFKLPAPQDGSCVEGSEDLLGPLAIPGARIAIAGPGPASASGCGALDLTIGPGGARIRGGKVTMPGLVRVLSRVLGRTVIDQTGFAGVFDVKLDFQGDDTTPALPPPPPGAEPAPAVSIFSAVQQLGLRLESKRGAAEVLVIDHVERPSAN